MNRNKDETSSLSTGSHNNIKNNYGSNDDVVSPFSSRDDKTNSRASKAIIATASYIPSSSSSSSKKRVITNHHHANVRFMVMIFTGITFLMCVSFIFIQTSLSILHDRRQQRQGHSEESNAFFHKRQRHQYDPSIVVKPNEEFLNTNSSSQSSSLLCCNTNGESMASSLSCTFRRLGQNMIPPAYESMMNMLQQHLYTQSVADHVNATTDEKVHAIATNESVKAHTTSFSAVLPPSKVNYNRKQILYVRDLVDIFSPIYSNTTARYYSSNDSIVTTGYSTEDATVDGNDDDPWTTIRSELDIGYTLIGQYQDLDHSHVQYTTGQKLTFQNKIMQWYNQFTATIADGTSSTVSQYLSLEGTDMDATATTTSTTWYTHTTESRLFWRDIEKFSFDHQHQEKETLKEEQQQLRSINDSAINVMQLLFLKQIHLAKEYYMKAYEHVSVLSSDSDQIDYHNLRKVLRCIVDEYNMFFASTSSSTSSCCRPILFLDPNIVAITKDDINTFDTARNMLGDLNDDWNAYKFRINHQPKHEKKETAKYDANVNVENPLMKNIDTKWNSFKSWSVNDSVNMLEVFSRLLEST